MAMVEFRSGTRAVRDWWFRVCTGHEIGSALDEEHYRLRILVMASTSWLLAVLLLTIAVPFIINLTPEGQLAAKILFLVAGVGVLLSISILRFTGDRHLALNVLLLIFAGSFAASCIIFGGTDSPTFAMMLVAPVLAGIAGSVKQSVLWSALVLAFWIALAVAEQMGFEFKQIIKPENYSFAVLLTHGATMMAVIAVLTVYAKMNMTLRRELQASNTELAHLSTHDQLTGLPNRRFYDQRAGQVLRRSSELNNMTGLLYLDLNDFKEINDTYGHGAGDQVLATVAQRLRKTFRETDFIARLGGDEFAAVIEDVRSPEELTKIAQKLAPAIAEPVTVRQHALTVSASIGIAVFPLDGRQKEELEELADRAMYNAKKRGIAIALASLENKYEPVPVRQRP